MLHERSAMTNITPRFQRVTLLGIAALLGLALLLAGCGGTTSAAATSAPPTATSAPTDTPAPTNTPAPSGPKAAVAINGAGTYSFSPTSMSVKVGTTVTWTNNSAAPHTVTSDSGPASFNGNVDTGGTFSFTFTKAGT